MIDEIEFPNLKAALEQYAAKLRDTYRANLAESGHSTRPNSLQSTMEWYVEYDGTRFSVLLDLNEYWKWVENDTRPHWPPQDALREWVRMKPVLPSPDANGKLPSVQSLAFLIGRAIAGKSPNQLNLRNPNGGTTGTHDLQRAEDSLAAEFTKAVTDGITADIWEQWGDIMNLKHYM